MPQGRDVCCQWVGYLEWAFHQSTPLARRVRKATELRRSQPGGRRGTDRFTFTSVLHIAANAVDGVPLTLMEALQCRKSLSPRFSRIAAGLALLSVARGDRR